MRGTSKMKYPILTLNDDTEFVHSQMLADGSVEVYIEKPDEVDGFHNASCYLPSYRWENINGFTETEIATYQEIIESMAHLIIEFSRTGGFQNASNLVHNGVRRKAVSYSKFDSKIKIMQEEAFEEMTFSWKEL